MVGGRHRRAWRWGLALTTLLLAVGLASLVVPNIDRRSTTPHTARGDDFGEPADAAGQMDDPRPGAGPEGGDLGGGLGQSPAKTPPMDLATLMSDEDLTHLVGRSVSFQVDTRDLASDVAFWVGTGGERLLVVAERDTRDGLDRQVGRPPQHEAMRAASSEPAVVSGVIERVPYAEATYSWNLSREDIVELSKRDVYIRAVTITPAAPAPASPGPAQPGPQGQ